MASTTIDVEVRYVRWRFAIGTALMRVPWLPLRLWCAAFNFAASGATLGGKPFGMRLDADRCSPVQR